MTGREVWQARYEGGETFRDIAATDGVDWTTVRRAVTDSRPRGTRPDRTPMEIVDAVLRTGGVKDAAAELDCSRTAIRRGLWRAGLTNDPKGVGGGRPDLDWPREARQHFDLRARMERRDATVHAWRGEGLSAAEISSRCSIDGAIVESILRRR